MEPNVLIMIADDATYLDLSLYGGQNVDTPNIDGLARDGLVFNRAYLPMAMCNPCRTALYTGLYPGAQWVVLESFCCASGNAESFAFSGGSGVSRGAVWQEACESR